MVSLTKILSFRKKIVVGITLSNNNNIIKKALYNLLVMYPEFYCADQYIHQIHEGPTKIGAEWVSFPNLCLQMLKKCTL